MSFLRFLMEGDEAEAPRRGSRGAPPRKDLWHAYLLWFGAGWAGGHRFFLGRKISGAAMALLFLFGVIVGSSSGNLFWLKASLLWWGLDGLILPFLRDPPRLFPFLQGLVQEHLGQPQPRRRRAQAKRRPPQDKPRRAPPPEPLDEEEAPQEPAPRRRSAAAPPPERRSAVAAQPRASQTRARAPVRERRPPLRERLEMKGE